MMKKVLAMLMTLTMLFSCIVTSVSVSAVVVDKYAYEPGNVMITGYRKGFTNYKDGSEGASMLSWKNPTSSTLSDVKIYRVDGSTETNVTSLAKAHVGVEEGYRSLNTPSAVCRLIEKHTETSGNITYRLVFSFSDEADRNILYTGAWKTYNGYNLLQSQSPKNNGDCYPMYAKGYPTVNEDGETVQTSDTMYPAAHMQISSEKKKGGTVSLKFETNSWAKNVNTDINGNETWVDISGSNDAIYLQENAGLTKDTDYTIKMQINTIEDAYFNVGSQTNRVQLPNTNGEWQEFTTKFTAENNNMYLKTSSQDGAIRELYIDDVEIYDEMGNTQVYSEDFERSHTDKVHSAPSGLVADPQDGQVEISWTNAEEKRIRVYEVDEDGNYNLRAYVQRADGKVTIKGLTNDKEYKFAVLTSHAAEAEICAGNEGAAEILTVTPQKSAMVKYDYEPGNILITGQRIGTTFADGKKGASNITWKNPTSDKLSDVKIYRVNEDGTETDMTSSAKAHYGTQTTYTSLATPGAIGKLIETYDGASGTVKYRLVFTFSDGQVRDIIYSDNWYAFNGIKVFLEDEVLVGDTKVIKNGGSHYGFISYGPLNSENKPYSMTHTGIISMSSETANSGVASLKLMTNTWAVDYDTYQSKWTGMDNDYVNLLQNAGLTTDTSYKIKMYVNSIETAKLIIGKSTVNIPNTNGKWKQVEYSFTASDANLQFKTVGSAGGIRELYIDDIEIYDAAGTTKLYSDDYERKNYQTLAAAPNVTATGGNAQVTVSWTDASYNQVNVYEVTTEGDYVLRAHVPASDGSVTLKNLKNDVQHNFAVKCVRAYDYSNYNGFEGNAALVSATPVAPDFEVTDISLLSGTEKAESIEKGGAYTASAKVVNNKLAAGFKAQLIACVYANGVLEGCYVSTPETVTKGSNKTLTVDSFTVGNKDAVYTAKLMLWKGLDSASPIVQAIPYAQAAVSAE